MIVKRLFSIMRHADSSAAIALEVPEIKEYGAL